ncbi:MAG: hypothetical protein CFE21_04360 [Bacteroidetes bacterium B1(2017)]|nr:MAG: hypothetical protein CFE21_04360 [Bacteroidetes bacterium B1(2017)]
MNKQKKRLNNFLLFWVLFSFQITVVSAQVTKLNELKQLLLNHSALDTARVNLLTDIGYQFQTIQQDSSIFYAQEALKISNKLNYPNGIANSYKLLGVSNYLLGNNIKAIELNRKALDLFKQLKDKKGEAAILNNMAIIYHNEGKYDLALEYYEFSLNLRKEINDQKGIAACYNNIANTYTDKGNYTASLEKLFEALLIREKLNDSLSIANSYSNIAGVYYYLKKLDDAYSNALKALKIQESIGDKEGMIQSSVALGGVCVLRKKYQQALSYFTNALAYSRQINSLDGESVALTNLGETYNLLKKSDLAIDCFNKAIKTCQQYGDLQGIAICELGIGQALVDKNQDKEGIIHLEKGFRIAKEIQNKIHIYEGAKCLADAYAKINNLAKENAFLKVYLSYKDSIFNDETSRKSHQIEFNYLLEKKQNEITLLEKDKSIQQAKHNFQQLLLIGLASVILLLVLFLFFINRFRLKETHAKKLILKQKQELEAQAIDLKELNIYKDKTFSILSHDLKNPVSNLTNFVELLDQEVLTESDFAMARVTFRKQLKSINLLLDNTLSWAKTQMAGELKPVKEHTLIALLVQRNFDLFKQQAEDKSIQLSKDVPETVSAWVDPNHLDCILRNILFNAIKFTPNNGQVHVISFVKESMVYVQIKDTGLGMNKEDLANLFTYKMKQGNYGTNGERGAGIGLILCKDFVDRNNGTIEVKSELNVGTTFTVGFPIK